ncbi:MAG TPA: amino acid ABC transporter permease [Microbacterium sp.]|uniref:amino acid ABC transporter permease n=1 Tax=Microbacterium sp. TaxID=51671 RepID=UPI002B460D64|nr:amino acid ABC transporter permease [Microbacterium sp.]HKT56938.1 amino acid ABC transporter permease [Microbacterium sp.]
MSFLLPHLAEFGQGILLTIALIVLGWAGALVLGTVLAGLRVCPLRTARLVATGYVLVFRNVPLPVQMVLFVFGLPLVGIQLPLFASAAVVLIVYTAAFVCETLRAGMNTVTVGELEASRALGFSGAGTLVTVVFPQAFAAMVMPMGNVLITMIKNTSVSAIVGVAELTFTADQVAIAEVQPFIVLGGAAVAYVVIGLLVRRFITTFERKVSFAR